MPDRNYYCICDDNCKFPTMTKEQIIAAIAEATGYTPEDIDDAFITKIKESNHNASLTFWKGTQAEFNALGVTAAVYKIGIDSNAKIYITPMTDEDVPAHASIHKSGGGDELTAEDIGALPVDGGEMTGSIDMNGNSVTGLSTPVNSSDAASKQYVDSKTNYKTDIVLLAGDGYGSDDIHENVYGYQYLDTSDTLNIDLSKHMLELDVMGCGAVEGDSDSLFAAVKMYFAGGSDFETIYLKNGHAITAATDTIKNAVKYDVVFGDGLMQREQYWMNGNYKTAFTNKQHAGIYGNTVKRVQITGMNSQNVIMSMTVRFKRID